MSSTSNWKNHQISMLHFRNSGIRSVSRIHREINIPLRTIYYNIDKLKEAGENGRPRVVGGIPKKAIGQYIRRNNAIILIEIIDNLSKKYNKSVSIWTISNHLHEFSYKNVLPKSAHMLTPNEKEGRESSFQLFRNTVRRWTKNPNKELKCSPKNCQKAHIWCSNKCEGILDDYLLPAARHQFGQHWRLQQDNDPEHRSNVCKQFIDDDLLQLLDWPSNSPDANPIENI
ncbi:unnamed protein product [Rotaria socialis]|uniref:Uncharacterized protein n=1 Tax=Rotaria socialis TaxID=392032 RepID=A0A821J7U2_9BILA|nr:unnamed protein product [Rotaria socialis]